MSIYAFVDLSNQDKKVVQRFHNKTKFLAIQTPLFMLL